MIIKDYKYENSTDGIHYIIDVDGYNLKWITQEQIMVVYNTTT